MWIRVISEEIPNRAVIDGDLLETNANTYPSKRPLAPTSTGHIFIYDLSVEVAKHVQEFHHELWRHKTRGFAGDPADWSENIVYWVVIAADRNLKTLFLNNRQQMLSTCDLQLQTANGSVRLSLRRKKNLQRLKRTPVERRKKFKNNQDHWRHWAGNSAEIAINIRGPAKKRCCWTFYSLNDDRELMAVCYDFDSHVSICLFAATSSMTRSAASGPSSSCCPSYLNSATPFSSCCASSRWSSCTGIITSRFWCIRGSRTRNTPRRPAGSSSWTTASTASCTPTMPCERSSSAHRASSRWWSPPFSWLRWSSAVPSTSGRTDSSKRPDTPHATFHQPISNSPSPCTLVTSSSSPAFSTSPTCRATHARARSSRPLRWLRNKPNNWTTKSRRNKSSARCDNIFSPNPTFFYGGDSSPTSHFISTFNPNKTETFSTLFNLYALRLLFREKKN